MKAFTQPTVTIQDVVVFQRPMSAHDIIEDCLRRYYFALPDGQTLADIYPIFKSEAITLLGYRGLTPEQTEYLLRSYRFVEFAKNLVNPPTSASVPGDVNHVSA